MSKRLILALAFVASTAWAQQNVDISAEQFNSGDANGTLASLGRQAAATGKKLVITAPAHWHARIAASIRSGGNADIVLKDGFYENVLVHIEAGAAEPAKEEAKPVEAKPEVKPEPARMPPPATKPAPVAEPADLPVSPPPPPVVESAAPAPAEVVPAEVAPEPEAVAPAEVIEPAPAPTETAPPPAAEEAASTEGQQAAAAAADPKAPLMFTAQEPGDVDSVRASLETRYNDGNRISELLDVAKLRRADVIYTGEGVAVVARREGGRLYRMWLVGTINLNQIGIAKDGANRYRVIGSIVN